MCLEMDKIYNILDIKTLIYGKIVDEFGLIGKGNNNFLNYVKSHNYLKGQKVFANIDNKIQEIEVIDINDDCSLKVIYNGKTQNLNSGEITFHI